MVEMETKEFIDYLLASEKFDSYYGIAKYIRDNSAMPMQTIQISHYHKGRSVMGTKVAEVVAELFEVQIVGAYKAKGRPSVW